MIRDLLRDVLLGLAPIGAGTALLLFYGRPRPRPAADVHDVSDYHPTPTPAEPTRVVDGYRRRLRTDRPALVPAEPLTALTAPISTLDLDVAAPIWEHLAARQILRELGREARLELTR